MRISIFGLGYVGAVLSGCLAKNGHQVFGVDPVDSKVDLINQGLSPIVEQDIGDIIHQGVESGRLRATTDPHEALEDSELSFICVGTPSLANGDLNLKYVQSVAHEIGTTLRTKNGPHTVVVRSTMLPGSTQEIVIPTLESASGKMASQDFQVCYNPEFLREGSAVSDYYNPPKTVIGEAHPGSGDALVSIYKDLDAPLIRTSLAAAELVKYIDNAWHALKISFANEVGNLSKAVQVDGQEIMDIFTQDTKLNISKAYLKPGFAFGGSCLPKDVRALSYRGRKLDLNLPVLNSILPSNTAQIDRAYDLITTQGKKTIGVLGFSFKAGTDDLRESPVVELVERLIGKGYEVKLYDGNVHLATLMGSNRDYILNQVPHISKLVVSTVDELLNQSEIVVIGNADPEFAEVGGKLRDDQFMIDLVGLNSQVLPDNYEGICW